MIRLSEYDSPCGRMVLGDMEGKLCLCDWNTPGRIKRSLERIERLSGHKVKFEETALIQKAKEQLTEYFQGERKEFDIPLQLMATQFQKRVLEQLMTIPYGYTTSYAALAEDSGFPKATRAVANTIGANLISIIIPCHRVIGKNGRLTGYAGGLDAKQYLLNLETASKRKFCNFAK